MCCYKTRRSLVLKSTKKAFKSTKKAISFLSIKPAGFGFEILKKSVLNPQKKRFLSCL